MERDTHMSDRTTKDHLEGGEARVRGAMERIELEHRRHRKNAIVAAIVGVVVLAVIGAVMWSRLGAASALGRDAQRPATVAGVPTETVAPSAQTPEGEPTPAAEAVSQAETASSATAQVFDIRIGERGYEPSVVRARAGLPVTLIVAQGEGCAEGFLIASLGIDANNSSGPATVNLGALEPGTYRFTCGMDMVEGNLVVE